MVFPVWSHHKTTIHCNLCSFSTSVKITRMPQTIEKEIHETIRSLQLGIFIKDYVPTACCRPNCTVCPRAANDLLISNQNRHFRTRPLYCETAGIIYALQCLWCSELYVGQTGRPLHNRLQEHIGNIRRNETSSKFATHMRAHSGPLHFQVYALDYSIDKFTRLLRESAWIKTSKQNKMRHETNIHNMHGGIKKTHCPNCKSSFTRTADLQRHMKRQHGTLLLSTEGTPKAADIILPTALDLPKISKVKPTATVSVRPTPSPPPISTVTMSEQTLEEDPLTGINLNIDRPINLAPRRRIKPSSPAKHPLGVRDRLLSGFSPPLPLNTPELRSRASTPALTSPYWTSCLEESELWDMPTTTALPVTPTQQTLTDTYQPIVSDISQASTPATLLTPVILPPEAPTPLTSEKISPAHTPVINQPVVHGPDTSPRRPTPPPSPLESEHSTVAQTPNGIT